MEKTDAIDQYLSGIYYDPKSPASYSSAFKIWLYIKSRKDRPKNLDLVVVKDWLKKQNTQAIHLPPKSKFETEAITVEYMDMQWDGDTLDLSQLAKYNNGFKYLVVFIDLFSRFLWVRAMKTKSADDTVVAIESIFKEERVPEACRTDAGTEYKNAKVKALFENYSVFHFIAYGQHKANYAERVNRTLEDRLYKYFYENQTYKYIDIIDDIVFSYNNTIHSSINLPPADVTKANSYEIYEKVYLPILNKRAAQARSYSFGVGDIVRLSLQRSVFSRGYQESWTEEIFKINKKLPSHPPRYKIEDLEGEIVKGSFYNQELLKVDVEDVNDISFKIEKILAKKKINGVPHSHIKWLGYPKKFNTWLPTNQVENYKGKS